MTSNELMQRVDEMNQQYANNQPTAANSVAVGANSSNVSDQQAEQMDELLANIFKRGGY